MFADDENVSHGDKASMLLNGTLRGDEPTDDHEGK